MATIRLYLSSKQQKSNGKCGTEYRKQVDEGMRKKNVIG